MVRSVTPMISAASHQVIFLAIAFNNTSCSFIIRSVSAAEYCPVVFNPQLPPPLFQSGHFMCEFHRTDHILATADPPVLVALEVRWYPAVLVALLAPALPERPVALAILVVLENQLNP